MAERRGGAGGRRDTDAAIYVLVHQVEALDKRFDKAVAEIKDQVREHQEATDRRIRELETFHIEDRTIARERISDRARELEDEQRKVRRFQNRTQWITTAVAVLGLAGAILEHFLHL